MIKLENVVPASPEQMEFIIQGMRNPISNYSDDMTEKEVNDEHNRAIDELISFDFLNIYKKVPRNSKVALDLGATPV